jgi:hypothetical protein
MNGTLDHYQLNKILEDILFKSFSFIKNITLKRNNTEIKKEYELYEKYLKYINSKIDNYLGSR